MNVKKTSLFIVLIVLFTSFKLIAQDSFFIKNKGQVFDQFGQFNNEVRYVLSLKQYNVSFYDDHFSYELFSSNIEDSTQLNVERIEVWFNDVNSDVLISSSREIKEGINVFKNGESFTNIKSFESIYYHNILNGVDVEFTIQENQLKYNYIVSSQSVNEINLKVKGGKVVKKDGDLYFKARNNQIKETIPESYYLLAGNKKKQANITVNTSSNRIQYVLPKNRKETFIIDPIAYGNEYTTYYGGAHLDFANSINVSKTNQVIVSGFTVSTNNIATTGAYQTSISDQDAFIASFDDDGNRNWATYFGGDGQERCYSASLDSNDNIFISGNTTSQIGLATPGSFQQYIASGDDGFISKFSSTGMLIWSSYYGGDGHDLITTVTLDDSNKVYVTGHTASTNLQCTPNAFRNNLSGFENAFLGVFDNNGAVIYNSYYLKGSNTRGEGIAVAKDGTIYFGGYTNDSETIGFSSVHQNDNGGFIDGFLFKLDAQYQMLWKTYIGGELNDLVRGIAIDSLQNIYIIGKTKSGVGITTANGLQNSYSSNWDGFVVKLDSSSERKWGTYIQAGSNEELTNIKFQDSTMWLLGITNGNDLLVDSSAFQFQNNGGFDNMIIKLSDTGGLIWSTYFGETNDEFGYGINVDATNKILISGQTRSNSNLVTLNAHQSNFGGNLYDGFWTKLCKPINPTILSKTGTYTICEGDSVNVTSIYAFESYLWTNGDTTNSFAITQSGNYVLKTKDINNCPGRSDTISVTVIPSENISLEQSSSAICNNDSVLLFINDIYSSYQWSNGDTTSSIYIKDEQPYSLSVTNTQGCQYDSDTVTLTTAQYSYPIFLIGDTIICSGGEAILYTNQSLSDVSWSNSEVSNSISVNSSGQYYFNAVDTNGCSVISDTVSITQVSYSSPSLVLDTISYISVCFGDTVGLNAEDNFTAYEWSNGVTSQFIEITESGDYYVEATDSNDCVGISDSIEVVVNSLPIVEIIDLPDTLCLKDSVLISANSGLQGYNWSNGEVAESFYLPLNNSGLYQLKLTGSGLNNCYNYDSIMFNVIDCILFNNIKEKSFDDNLKITNSLNEVEIESDLLIEKVFLIDYQGRVIYSNEDINSRIIGIDISNIPTSVYIIKVLNYNKNKPLLKKISILKK